MRVFDWLPGGPINCIAISTYGKEIEGDEFKIFWNSEFYTRAGDLTSDLIEIPNDGEQINRSGLVSLLGKVFEQITFADNCFHIWIGGEGRIVIPFDDLEVGYVVAKREGGGTAPLFFRR